MWLAPSAIAEYTSSDTEAVDREGHDEVSSLGESMEASSPDTTGPSTLRLVQNKQELMKQHHLKKHIKNLEDEVHEKEEVVNKLR